MKITLAHAGKQHSYHVAKAMNDLNVLDKFYTSGYASGWLRKISGGLPGNPMQRRFMVGLPDQKVSSNWRFEVKEHYIRQVLRNTVKARTAVYERDVYFDQFMVGQLSHSSSSHFWGFQGSCHDALHRARRLGKVSICELATAHVKAARRILGEESALHPLWAFTIDNLVFPSAYERRLEEEPHVAQWVIAASDFTRQTLLDAQVPESKIKTLALGFSIDHISFQVNSFRNFKNRPLKLLYAGRVTQRKGIFYLLEALKRFNPSDVELHIVGQMNGAQHLFVPYEKFIHYHGAKTQQEMFNAYKNFDVLVLPSLFEGFGLVIVEAMAAGLPVIATPNTVGPELIAQNINGKIIPIRSIDALEESIGFFCSLSEDEFTHMRLAARKSAEFFSWDHYRDRLAELLTSL